MSDDLISTAEAEALFLSWLQPSQRPGPHDVALAVHAQLAAHHNDPREIAADVAGELAEHPIEAAARWSWALSRRIEHGAAVVFGVSDNTATFLLDPAARPSVPAWSSAE